MRIVEHTKDIAIKLWKDESGASLLEYAVLIGLITAASVTAITNLGGAINTKFTDMTTLLTGSTTTGGSGDPGTP
jgi:pilus assembly protein Flp/PilA